MQHERKQTRPTFSTLMSEALQQRLAQAAADTGEKKYEIIERILTKHLPKWRKPC